MLIKSTAMPARSTEVRKTELARCLQISTKLKPKHNLISLILSSHQKTNKTNCQIRHRCSKEVSSSNESLKKQGPYPPLFQTTGLNSILSKKPRVSLPKQVAKKEISLNFVSMSSLTAWISKTYLRLKINLNWKEKQALGNWSNTFRGQRLAGTFSHRNV